MDKNACFSQSPYEVAQSWLDAALAQNDAATAQNELFRAPIWSDGAHIKSFWSDELAKNWSVLIIPKAKNTQDEAVLLILSAAKDGSWQPVSAQPTSATLLWPQM